MYGTTVTDAGLLSVQRGNKALQAENVRGNMLWIVDQELDWRTYGQYAMCSHVLKLTRFCASQASTVRVLHPKTLLLANCHAR